MRKEKTLSLFLSIAGFHVNSAVLQAIVSRYADAQYAIDFDSFVGCLIKLEMLFSAYQQTHTHTQRDNYCIVNTFA